MHNDASVDATNAAESESNAPVTDAEQSAPARVAYDADRPDRLPPAVAVGVMLLLLLCATLVLVASNRAPV